MVLWWARSIYSDTTSVIHLEFFGSFTSDCVSIKMLLKTVVEAKFHFFTQNVRIIRDKTDCDDIQFEKHV